MSEGGDSGRKDDVVLLTSPSESGEGIRVVRKRDDAIELGELRPMREGQPIHGEVVRLTPREEHALLFDCEVMVPSPARKEPKQLPAPVAETKAPDPKEREPAAITHKGPPRVTSEAYRGGWDLIFGGKRPGSGDAPELMRRALLAAGLLALGCGESAPAPESDPPAEIRAEAGFVDIEPVRYTVRGGAETLDTTASAARLFYDFRPAEGGAEGKPLIVLYSGGPGASTGILLGGSTGPLTLDRERTGGASSAPNAASWTAFASLLYLDARGAGFSYGVADGMDGAAARSAEFTVRNFNSFLDAADVVRAVLRFLGSHPRLRFAPVVLAGESYGGVRTEVALHLLHHPERYDSGAALYEDSALADEIRAHFEAAGTTAAAQFDRAVFLQARISSPAQQAAAGAALEAKGSMIWDVAEETGVAFVPCSENPAPCTPFSNVLDYLAAAGRDIYDVRRPAGDALARYADIGGRLEDPIVIEDALGVELASIGGLAAKARAGAYRLKDAAPEDEPLTAEFGALQPYDRYFEMELFDLLGAPFAGNAAQALGIERQSGRYGEAFLEDLLDVRAFVTNAAYDAVIWTPALPDALAMYTELVAGVHTSGGALTIDYRPGAFGVKSATSREVRFASYGASGHSVSLDQPEELAADIAAWLAAP